MKKSAADLIKKNLIAYKQVKEYRRTNFGRNPPGVTYNPIIILLGPTGSCKTTGVK
jgi:flagellar biosynthesis GTPase FlhF